MSTSLSRLVRIGKPSAASHDPDLALAREGLELIIARGYNRGRDLLSVLARLIRHDRG